MEKITTEELVIALLKLGFDKIDSCLYTYTEEKIAQDKVFSLKDQKISKVIEVYMEYNDFGFSLKEEYTLKTNISPVDNYNIPLERILHTNPRLLKYLEEIDFKVILLNKIKDLSNTPEELPYLFCEKEKQLLEELFGIKNKKTKLKVRSKEI